MSKRKTAASRVRATALDKSCGELPTLPGVTGGTCVAATSVAETGEGALLVLADVGNVTLSIGVVAGAGD